MPRIRKMPLPEFDGEKEFENPAEINRVYWNLGFQETRPIYPYAFSEPVRQGSGRLHDRACRFGQVTALSEGELRYHSGGRSWLLRGKRFLVIPPGTEFRFETTRKGFYHKLNLMILGVNLPGILDTLGLGEMELLAAPEFDGIIGDMREIGNLIATGDECRMPEMAGRTLALLTRLAALRNGGEPESPLFRQAKARLGADFDRPLVVSELAAELRISQSTLERMFKKRLRMTPREFRIRARLARARELLLGDSLSIKEIAYRLGYCNPFHFTNEFTRVNGLSPARFRRDNSAEPLE